MQKIMSALEEAATPSEEARAHRGLVIAHARLAPGEDPPDIPPLVLKKLREAVAITAALGLQRSACRKVIQDEFLIRLLLRLDDLEVDGLTELMQHTRAALDVASVQQQQ
jgi:hypothetical protein